jgi:hypothetical protein
MGKGQTGWREKATPSNIFLVGLAVVKDFAIFMT